MTRRLAGQGIATEVASATSTVRESLSAEEGLEMSLSEELKRGESIDIVSDVWLCEASSAEGGREDAGGDATG